MKFITGKPALIYKKNLVIGDLHIGHPNLVSLDKAFSKRMVDDINFMIKKYKCKRLIILGDVKDDILTVSSSVYQFFEKLSFDNVVIVKGNHDGRIEKVCDSFGYEVCSTHGCVIDNIGLVHGHTWPDNDLMKRKYLIMSHLHQTVTLKDKFGKVHTVHVWMTGEVNPLNKRYEINPKIKLIVVPAFNPLMGHSIGYDSLRISPILKNNVFKLNSFYIYDLNGILLGRLIDFLEGDYGKKKKR